MGLPVWSSIGFCDDEDSSSGSKTDTAQAQQQQRSPIRRRSPTRNGRIRHPVTGETVSFRRPTPLVRPPNSGASGASGAPGYRRVSSRSLAHGRFPSPPLPLPLPPPPPPPSNISELRGALDELTTTMQHNLTLVETLEGSFASRPPAPAAAGAVEAALRQSAIFRRNLRDMSVDTASWEQMVQFEYLTTGQGSETVSNICAQLSCLRRDLSAQMSRVMHAFRLCHTLVRQTAMFRAQFGVSPQELDRSVDPVLSPLPIGLEVRPLSPTATEAARDAGELPPLRRMGNRSITDGPASFPATSPFPATAPATSAAATAATAATPPSVDGLGDRTRSTSPDNDTGAWDTMLMTLEPDARLPSTDSSFTSAAASASFSAADGSTRPNSTSANSSRTHLTVPSPEDDSACESEDSDFSAGLELYSSRVLGSRPSHAHQRLLAAPPPPGSTLSTHHHQNHRHAPGGIFRLSPETEARIRQITDRRWEAALAASEPGPQPSSASLPDSAAADGGRSSRLMRLYDAIFNTSEADWPLSDTSPAFTPEPGLTTSTVEARGEFLRDLEDRIHHYRSTEQSHRTPEPSRPSGRRGASSSLVPSDLPPARTSVTDPEIEHMRGIAERMANRDEVPDELWASAGLTPRIADDNTRPASTPRGRTASGPRE